ncbi:12854_t:CDS:2 [Cetraspora pellucida]|uniref:12854_t:CDS:1 n=1 Tax=Cetraspora pellucida TaxID=1433469 RepID=A0ACA9K7S9_9GLOM|nr:12854_t:CDS:2 [Cetraspora pellucida]
MTYVQAPPQAKGLTVQLLVFYGKEKENVATWLLQVDLLYKAYKIEDEKRLQYIITGLKDAALQWYFNKVQAYEAQKPFEESTPQGSEIYWEVEQMDEADKILNFIKGLKLATKAEVSYQVLKSLENAIRLATIYDTAMYVVDRMGSLVSEETGSNSSKVSSQKNNEIVPIELDRTKVRKFYGNIKKGKQGHIAKTCPSKQTSNPGTSSSTNANAEQANLIEKEVSVCSEKKEKLLRVKGKISKKDALILIDSKTYQLMINKSIEEKSIVELADGTPCKSCGHMLNVKIQMYSWKECKNRMEDQKVFNINGNANGKLIRFVAAIISKNQLVKKAKQNAKLFAVLTINTQNATDDKRINISEFLKEVIILRIKEIKEAVG